MISFILPIRNEVQSIEKTIQSIFSQTIEEDFVIIVAYGMSTVGTREIIQELEKHNPKLYLIDSPGQIVSTFNTNYEWLSRSFNI